MIHDDLQHVKESKIIRIFCGFLVFVVETLHAAEGDLFLRAEPVEQKVSVITDRPGRLLHRGEPRPHGSCEPVVKELEFPTRHLILPEPLGIFLEQVGPNTFQVIGEQILQFVNMLVGKVLRTLQRTTADPGQDLFFPLGAEGIVLLGTGAVDGLVHVAHNLEAIEGIDCTWRLLSNEFRLLPPHFAADKTHALTSFFPEPVEGTPKCSCGTIAAGSEQPPPPAIQLADQGDNLPLVPADLVGANGRHIVQVAMGKPLFHRYLDLTENVLPVGLKGPGNRQPGKALASAGKRPSVGGG